MPSLPVLFRVCKEENQPPRYVCDIPSHTRFINLVISHFHSQISSDQSNRGIHSNCKLWAWKKNILGPKLIVAIGKNDQDYAIHFKHGLWLHMGQNGSSNTQKSWSLPQSVANYQKTISHPGKNGVDCKKHEWIHT